MCVRLFWSPFFMERLYGSLRAGGQVSGVGLSG